VELLVALTLGVLLMTGVVGFVAASSRWADRISARADALELARTVWVVLDQELRPGVPLRDWRLESERAVALRAFRGVGRVCGPAGGRWAVAWRGLRVPDPARDSVLVLAVDGGWRAAPLLASSAGGTGCDLAEGESGRVLDWTGSADVDPVLVRVFEAGRYSLEDGAFRYRRGAGGRQPLTPERVRDGSRFEAEGSGIRVFLEVDAAGVAIPFGWKVTSGEQGSP
jgi:hypothetical protein